MLNNDEIIARFMGWKIDNSFPDKECVYRIDNAIETKNTFKYSISWNALMSVVKKISFISENENFDEKTHRQLHEFLDLPIDTTLDDLYKEIILIINLLINKEKII